MYKIVNTSVYCTSCGRTEGVLSAISYLISHIIASNTMGSISVKNKSKDSTSALQTIPLCSLPCDNSTPSLNKTFSIQLDLFSRLPIGGSLDTLILTLFNCLSITLSGQKMFNTCVASLQIYMLVSEGLVYFLQSIRNMSRNIFFIKFIITIHMTSN